VNRQTYKQTDRHTYKQNYYMSMKSDHSRCKEAQVILQKLKVMQTDRPITSKDWYRV